MCRHHIIICINNHSKEEWLSVKEGNMSFNGMKELGRIGISRFVSYAYFCHVDEPHSKWKNTTTLALRKSHFERARQFHAEWIHRILDSNPARLARNTPSPTSNEIHDMTKELLTFID